MQRLFGWLRSNRKDLEYLECLREYVDAEQNYRLPQHEQTHAGTIRAIKTLQRSQEARSRNDRRQSDRELVWTRLTFAVVFAYTAVTFGLAVIGHNANVLNAQGGRAWVVPFSASASVTDKGVFAHFVFRNIGREPAQDVEFSRFQFRIGFVDPSGFPNIEEVNTCPYTKPLERGSSMYADIDYQNDWGNIGQESDLVNSLRLTGINQGKDVFSLQSCVVYVSLGQIRSTQICWYIKPERDKPGSFVVLRCPRWNRAK